jgi:hypothetical protein
MMGQLARFRFRHELQCQHWDRGGEVMLAEVMWRRDAILEAL